MKKWTAVLVTAAFSVAAVPAQTVLEEWTFSSEPNGTSFPGLVNSVGSAAWQRVIDDVPQAWAEEGISVSNGVLVSVGNASNVYQRAALTSPGATSGVYEITYDMPLVDFFPSNSQEQIVVRMDNGEGQENSLFQIRLTANDTKYYWNVRNASTGGGANYGDLGTDPLTNLSVRTRFDLQWNEFSSYYSIDGGPEQVIVEYETTNPDAHGKELNFLRFHSTPEKRSADQIAQFDNIRLSYVGPSLSRTVPVDGELVINYQMNDAAGTKLGALRQEGSDPASFSSAADIGGVEADGSGSLLYTNVAAGSKNHTINEISGESITTMEFALSEVDFSGMTDASSGLKFGLYDGPNASGVQPTVDFNGGLRVRWASTQNNGGTAIQKIFTGVTSVDDLVVKTVIDTGTGTYEGFWSTNGSSFVSAGVGVNDNQVISQFRLVTDNTPAWGNSYAKVDYCTVTVETYDSGADDVLVEYLMDDDIGTDIVDLTQSGSDPASLGGVNAMIQTDGLGDLVFTNLSGGAYHVHNLDQAITGGVVELEYHISEWDFTGMPDALQVGFDLRNTDAGNEGFKATLEYRTSETIKSRLGFQAGTNGSYGAKFVVDSGSDVTVKMRVDLDANTYSAFYKQAGDGWVTQVENSYMGLTGNVLNQFRLLTNNKTWPAGAFAKFDYVRVTRIREFHLVDFQLDDAAGTQFGNAYNPGTWPGAAWNFSGPFETDGQGNLRVGLASGATRKFNENGVPGGSLTKGVVDARWSVSAWDMTEGTNSAGVTWKLRGVGGSKDEVSIRFDQNGAGSNNDRVRVRSIDSENTGKQKTWAAGSLVSTTFGVDFRVVLDLDNATMEAYWKETADEDWTLIDAALSNGLTQLDDIWLVSTATTNAGYCDFDYFVVDHFVEPTVDPETPAEWYSQWLDDYPSLTLVELDDDEDADGADNLYEYATGGDPEDGNVTGIAHELSAVPGYLQVIHVQRSDADVRGLSYVLKTSTDLVHGSFTESGYVITGTNDNYEVEGFDAVTNLVPTDVYNAQFIKLEVGFTPGE